MIINYKFDLSQIPFDDRTSEICEIAVKNNTDNINTDNIKYVPLKFRTLDMCTNVLKTNISYIGYIPRNILTYKMCVEAVKSYEILLANIPYYHRTLELCLHAINKYSCVLKYVPKKFKTYEMCLNAIKGRCDEDTYRCECNNILKYIPHRFKTPELCYSLFTLNNNHYYRDEIKFIPKKIKTSDFYMRMVENSGYTLEWIANKRKTPELCLAAVKQIYYALEYVPENFKTKKMIAIAVENGLVEHTNELHRYVPQRYITTKFNHKIIVNETDDCPICVCNGGVWCKLECNHKFHLDCIIKSLSYTKSCPYCRMNINVKMNVNLEN
jgi:hypothetical protein